MSEFDVSIPIASYGILRKKGIAQRLVKEFNLKAVELIPDKIKGFVPYHSGGINFLFRVTERLKDKYPDADFTIPITLLSFKGTTPDLYALYDYIEALESGYERVEILTDNGNCAYVYVAKGTLKDLSKYFNFYGRGLVLYPDTILKRRYFVGENTDVKELGLLEYKVVGESEEEEE